MPIKRGRGSTPANDRAVDAMLARDRAARPSITPAAPSRREVSTADLATIDRRMSTKGRGSTPANDKAVDAMIARDKAARGRKP